MPYDLLEGVKVIDLTMFAFGPSCAAVLSDWGADVIRIVPPHVADALNGNVIAGVPKADVGIHFMWELVNRGKRCIGLDVAKPEGRELLGALVRDADVLVTSLLPSARRRFKLDPEDFFPDNPDLIYARCTGHGDRGDERELGGFDHTDFWARTGIGHAATQVSDEFVPQVGPAFGDVASGAFLAGGIAASLFRRERTGRSAVVEVSLVASGVWMFGPSIMASQIYDIPTIGRQRHIDSPNPFVNAYRTRDGRQIFMSGIRTDKHAEAFFELADCMEMLEDPRFATADTRAQNSRACIEALDEIFARHDLAEWERRLQNSPTPWARVQSAAEAVHDPQVVANGYVVQVEGAAGSFPIAASPVQVDGKLPRLERAPAHGEHTELVLMELGMEWDKIEQLKAHDVIN